MLTNCNICGFQNVGSGPGYWGTGWGYLASIDPDGGSWVGVKCPSSPYTQGSATRSFTSRWEASADSSVFVKNGARSLEIDKLRMSFAEDQAGAAGNSFVVDMYVNHYSAGNPYGNYTRTVYDTSGGLHWVDFSGSWDHLHVAQPPPGAGGRPSTRGTFA